MRPGGQGRGQALAFEVLDWNIHEADHEMLEESMVVAYDQGRNLSQAELLISFLRFFAEKFNEDIVVDIT